MRPFPVPGLLLLAPLLLAGCPHARISEGNQPAANAAPPAAAQPARETVPYALTAKNVGSFIEFTVQNNSTTDLPVRPEEFALLVRGERRQIHYNPREVVIDLPHGCVVAPGQSVTGRARYLSIEDVRGHRLVFNPGSDPNGRQAVFAQISGPKAF